MDYKKFYSEIADWIMQSNQAAMQYGGQSGVLAMGYGIACGDL